ncbi:MAG: protein kinase, partial [Acaryochloris sp. SU_5_25]|nr:protein kinase [Acaryochloris sp. SU_5_25]
MIYCINPNCSERENRDDAEVCEYCGNRLIIENEPQFKSEKKYRLHLIEPVQEPHPMRTVELFEAKDVDSGEIRVLKLLKTPFIRVFEPDMFDFYIEHFQREFETLKRFNHPGIPRVNTEDYLTLDLTTTPNTIHAISFPKIEGVDLKQWMHQNPKISNEQAYDWLSQIADILNHVHQLGYFHRDIKPSNIMLQPDGKLMLIDFGGVRQISRSYLAKVSTAENESGVPRYDDVSILMSHGYTPLEQFNGKALPQSDFYALGRTLIRLVTGKELTDLPIDKKTGNTQWRQDAPQISKPLADFIDDLCAIAPTDRPKSTRDILARLKKLPRQIKWQQRLHSPTFGILAVLVFCALLVGGVKYGTQKLSRYYVLLANEQQSKGEFEAARGYYERAIQFDPNNKTAYNNLGVVCRDLQDLPCVLESFRKGLEVKPNDEVIFYN